MSRTKEVFHEAQAYPSDGLGETGFKNDAGPGVPLRRELSVFGFKDGWNWFLFDAVFKPCAVALIIILERWMDHRVGREKRTTTYKRIMAGFEEIKKGWGPSYPMYKLISLVALFACVDNAYAHVLDAFVRGYVSYKT